jgi:hypothetical protein
MTNGWGSIEFGGCSDMPRDFTTVTLKKFKGCLKSLCENKSILHKSGNSFNYGLCTLAHNLYGIFSRIASAIKQDENMVIERVVSEWSEGPFLLPVNVFDKMKEDLFRGRGSKQYENLAVS